MNLIEFYAVTGGDYDNMMARFLTEERILRFVRRFPADGSYSELMKALEAGDVQTAFRAAHTLKGVAQNLGFTALFNAAERVTEILRGGSLAVAEHLPLLTEKYDLVVSCIGELED